MALWFRVALPAALLLFGVVGFFAAVESHRISLRGLLALPRRLLSRRVEAHGTGIAAEVAEHGVASGP